jgi:hypothetical protein
VPALCQICFWRHSARYAFGAEDGAGLETLPLVSVHGGTPKTARSYVKFPSSPESMVRHFGQASTRPRRGRVDVKFTLVRSIRTTRSSEIISSQRPHRTGISSA